MAESLICSKLTLLLNQTASEYILFKDTNGCLGFPGDGDGKESAYNMGDPDLIPESGRCPGAGHNNPLQYSCLRIPWTEEPHRLLSIGSQRVGHD